MSVRKGGSACNYPTNKNSPTHQRPTLFLIANQERKPNQIKPPTPPYLDQLDHSLRIKSQQVPRATHDGLEGASNLTYSRRKRERERGPEWQHVNEKTHRQISYCLRCKNFDDGGVGRSAGQHLEDAKPLSTGDTKHSLCVWCLCVNVMFFFLFPSVFLQPNPNNYATILLLLPSSSIIHPTIHMQIHPHSTPLH